MTNHLQILLGLHDKFHNNGSANSQICKKGGFGMTERLKRIRPPRAILTGVGDDMDQ